MFEYMPPNYDAQTFLAKVEYLEATRAYLRASCHEKRAEKKHPEKF
jgi:hypothetical protein